MNSIADGVWIDTEPARILGMKLTVTMTVLRLSNDELLIYSPLRLTPERRERVAKIGKVAHLYAPNTFHHRWIGDWSRDFPTARVHAPNRLGKKRADLKIDRFCAQGQEPAFNDCIEEIPIIGFRLEETVLIYQPSRTLVVADLVHNVGRPAHWWAKVYTWTMGFYDRVALSRMIRWTGFSDRRAASRSIRSVLDRSFDRIVVGHGTPIETDARRALERAFEWLPPSS